MKTLINSWYRPQWWTAFLLPFSVLFFCSIKIRRLLYQYNILKSKKFDKPIIVVGNITVGGSGKTPLVIWLVEFLKAQGYKPGVVSRGYIPRRKAKKKPVVVKPESDAHAVGDEPVLIAQRTRVPVVVCANRVAAVDKLFADFDCDIVVSDDGLQHYAMARDIEIAVLDGKHRVGNGFLLPAGPLREPKERLKKVDFVVVNSGHPHHNEYSMRLLSGDAYNIQNPQQIKKLSDFVGQTLHAVAGIGHPKRFFNTLRDNHLLIVEHAYPDHHKFKKSDINFYGSLKVIMTEKDAVKCRAILNERHWCLPITAEFSAAFESALSSKLTNIQHKLKHANNLPVE